MDIDRLDGISCHAANRAADTVLHLFCDLRNRMTVTDHEIDINNDRAILQFNMHTARGLFAGKLLGYILSHRSDALNFFHCVSHNGGDDLF